MIRRALITLLWCTAALAQLPQPQAAPPKPEVPARSRKSPATGADVLHVDARVTDFQRRAVTGLTAADFQVETDGKPQKVTECKYEVSKPVRIALVIDDVSLSLPHLADVKHGVRSFVDRLPESVEAAIVRTSGGEGFLEQFTSDRTVLVAALDRVVYNPTYAKAANIFQVGTLGALQAVLTGLETIPGRKAVLLFSEGLREQKDSPRDATMRAAADRGGAVVYAHDAAGAEQLQVMLDQGIAALAEETGGKVFERGVDPAQALEDVVREQDGYYSIAFTAEGLSFDYLLWMPRIGRLSVKAGKDRIVRSRRGAMGGRSDPEGEPFRAPGGELGSGLHDAFLGSGMRVRLTALSGIGSASGLEAILHIDANDLVLRKGVNDVYEGEAQIAAEIFSTAPAGIQTVARELSARVGEEPRRAMLREGLDVKFDLNAPLPGAYLLRAAVTDAHNARMGTASQVILIPDWSADKVMLSSIVVGSTIIAGNPDPSSHLNPNAAPRVFPAGERVPYSYLVYNLHRNDQKHAVIEVGAEMLREGVRMYQSTPTRIDLDFPQNAKAAKAGGAIALSAQTPPGHYQLLLTVTDTLAPATAVRSVTQSIDFEVRPSK